MLRTLDWKFDVVEVMEQLRAAWEAARRRGDEDDAAARPRMLEAIAGALEAARGEIIATAAAESALTAEELSPEFARMVGTLRMFAEVTRTSAWRRPVENPKVREGEAPAIGPNHALRSMLMPLGPVAVFGASNFPLAYGVCGGDTASALAAGCPVVVKEHPAQPRTGRLVVKIARHAIAAAGGEEGMLGYVVNTDPTDFEPARKLVSDPVVQAVGFTGSRRGGLALEEMARARPDRIPVFAEMGSANPVVVTPRAMQERGAEIGVMLAESILMRHGQQCTCPGIVLVPDARGEGRALVEAMAARFDAAAGSPRDMLAPWVRDGYVERVQACVGLGEVRLRAGRAEKLGARGAYAALLETTSERFAWHTELREEIFGPCAVVVDVESRQDGFADVVGALPLPTSLTMSVFYQPDEAAEVMLARELAWRASRLAGRVILNGVPTGVRVAEAMVHGGPFAASNRPESTAVGPRAMERWCRPVCWQGEGVGEVVVGL